MRRIRTVRSNSLGKLLRTASMMLAALFLLLSPVCDAAAAPASSHAAAAAAHGHAGEGNCCASIDAQALAAPAAAPLPAAFPSYFIAPSRAAQFVVTALAAPSPIIVRRDAAPPLPYHARSLRRLD
jgi:hypothetical protein